MKQYFYKNDKCKAETALARDCICWHDEGSGPFPEARFADAPEIPNEWRDAPATFTSQEH